jgi:hypothetical protein
VSQAAAVNRAAVCPLCNEAVASGATSCTRCSAQLLDAAASEALLARIGVGDAVIREMLAEAPATHTCHWCASRQGRIVVRGASIFGCKACGALTIPADVALAWTGEAPPRTKLAPLVPLVLPVDRSTPALLATCAVLVFALLLQVRRPTRVVETASTSVAPTATQLKPDGVYWQVKTLGSACADLLVDVQQPQNQFRVPCSADGLPVLLGATFLEGALLDAPPRPTVSPRVTDCELGNLWAPARPGSSWTVHCWTKRSIYDVDGTLLFHDENSGMGARWLGDGLAATIEFSLLRLSPATAAPVEYRMPSREVGTEASAHILPAQLGGGVIETGRTTYFDAVSWGNDHAWWFSARAGRQTHAMVGSFSFAGGSPSITEVQLPEHLAGSAAADATFAVDNEGIVYVASVVARGATVLALAPNTPPFEVIHLSATDGIGRFVVPRQQSFAMSKQPARK